MSQLSEEIVLDSLKQIIDPDLKKDIVTLGFIHNLEINGGDVSFTIMLTTPACPVKEKMETGVDIEGYMTKPAKVELLSDKRFRITIREGKTHQIRRMVVAVFNEVTSLKRISVMNVKLATLAVGSYRKIEGPELEVFLKSLGLQ